MIQYQKILQMYFNGDSQRTIAAATGHSWRTVKDVIYRAENKNIIELKPEMDNLWLFGFLYPERQTFERGYYPVNWEYIHKELMKKNVTLQLLHREYKEKARNSKKYPYSYTSFTRGYRLFVITQIHLYNSHLCKLVIKKAYPLRYAVIKHVCNSWLIHFHF